MRYLIIILVPFILFSCQKKAAQPDKTGQSDKAVKTEIVKKGKKEDGATKKPVRVESKGTPEKFMAIDVSEINAKLAIAYDDLSIDTNLPPVQIMKMYFPNEENMTEGNENIGYEEGELGNGIYRVAMIHENMPDDSVNGEKYVMLLTKKNDRWSVISVEKNWKCQEGRGHTDWGIEPCD